MTELKKRINNSYYLKGSWKYSNYRPKYNTKISLKLNITLTNGQAIQLSLLSNILNLLIWSRYLKMRKYLLLTYKEVILNEIDQMELINNEMIFNLDVMKNQTLSEESSNPNRYR